MNPTKYIIIGNSAAGIAAIRTLRSLDPQGQIVCFSDEQEQPYNKCFLADFLSKSKQEKDLYTLSAEQLKQWHVDMRLGVRVTAIMSDNKMIMLQNGATESYDKLLIATGTRPFELPIDSLYNCTNVFSFHNLQSALALETYMQMYKPRSAVVIGAGLSGIEIADAFVTRGIAVSLVERSDRILRAHLAPEGSQLLEDVMSKAGVQIFKSAGIASVSHKDDQTEKILLYDGQELAADMVIITAGVRRNDELAHSAQLTMHEHGVTVDAQMQTNVPNIYAAGDIIAIKDRISSSMMASCTWPDAMQQGRCAAQAMAGKPQDYAGAYVIASSAFFGMKFYSCGIVDGFGCQIIERVAAGQYERYLLQNGQLKGFQLLGSGAQFGQLRRAVMTGEQIKV